MLKQCDSSRQHEVLQKQTIGTSKFQTTLKHCAQAALHHLAPQRIRSQHDFSCWTWRMSRRLSLSTEKRCLPWTPPASLSATYHRLSNIYIIGTCCQNFKSMCVIVVLRWVVSFDLVVVTHRSFHVNTTTYFQNLIITDLAQISCTSSVRCL